MQRERPTVAANTPKTARIISVPYGRTSDAAYRGLYHPLKAAGSRRHAGHGGTRIGPANGPAWGEHDGSRGGRQVRPRRGSCRVGGRVPLQRGAQPYQRSDASG